MAARSAAAVTLPLNPTPTPTSTPTPTPTPTPNLNPNPNQAAALTALPAAAALRALPAGMPVGSVVWRDGMGLAGIAQVPPARPHPNLSPRPYSNPDLNPGRYQPGV